MRRRPEQVGGGERKVVPRRVEATTAQMARLGCPGEKRSVGTTSHAELDHRVAGIKEDPVTGGLSHGGVFFRCQQRCGL